jgi:hypothetical protein
MGELHVGGEEQPASLPGAGSRVAGKGPPENDRGGAAFF